jgi:hypothetical protein
MLLSDARQIIAGVMFHQGWRNLSQVLPAYVTMNATGSISNT